MDLEYCIEKMRMSSVLRQGTELHWEENYLPYIFGR